jgi:hypothetical protein
VENCWFPWQHSASAIDKHHASSPTPTILACSLSLLLPLPPQQNQAQASRSKNKVKGIPPEGFLTRTHYKSHREIFVNPTSGAGWDFEALTQNHFPRPIRVTKAAAGYETKSRGSTCTKKQACGFRWWRLALLLLMSPRNQPPHPWSNNKKLKQRR